MSDPIERLTSFRTDIEGGAMLPAQEVRRRGDRRRRRRTATIAAAAVAAAVAVPVTIVAASGGLDTSGIDPATPLPPRGEALVTPAEMPDRTGLDAPLLPWEVWEPSEPAEEFPLLGCAPDLLGQLPADSTVSVQLGADTDIDLEPGDVLPPSPPNGKVGEAIADFDSAAAATEAYDELAARIESCDDPGEGRQLADGAPFEPVSVDLVDGEAFYARRDVWDTAVCDWRDGCDGWNTEFQGLARFADRLVAFSYTEINGNFEPEGLSDAAAAAFSTAIEKSGAEPR
jgi:hypothetical protein